MFKLGDVFKEGDIVLVNLYKDNALIDRIGVVSEVVTDLASQISTYLIDIDGSLIPYYYDQLTHYEHAHIPSVFSKKNKREEEEKDEV